MECFELKFGEKDLELRNQLLARRNVAFGGIEASAKQGGYTR